MDKVCLSRQARGTLFICGVGFKHCSSEESQRAVASNPRRQRCALREGTAQNSPVVLGLVVLPGAVVLGRR